jgi:hypothetical protein
MVKRKRNCIKRLANENFTLVYKYSPIKEFQQNLENKTKKQLPETPEIMNPNQSQTTPTSAQQLGTQQDPIVLDEVDERVANLFTNQLFDKAQLTQSVLVDKNYILNKLKTTEHTIALDLGTNRVAGYFIKAGNNIPTQIAFGNQQGTWLNYVVLTDVLSSTNFNILIGAEAEEKITSGEAKHIVRRFKNLLSFPTDDKRYEDEKKKVTFKVKEDDNGDSCYLYEDAETNTVFKIKLKHIQAKVFAEIIRTVSDLTTVPRDQIKTVWNAIPGGAQFIYIRNLEDAASIAKLRNTGVVTEAEAAGIYYILHKSNQPLEYFFDRPLVVGDVGGGTTDLTTITVSKSGFFLTHFYRSITIAGDDFTDAVMDMFVDKFVGTISTHIGGELGKNLLADYKNPSLNLTDRISNLKKYLTQSQLFRFEHAADAFKVKMNMRGTHTNVQLTHQMLKLSGLKFSKTSFPFSAYKAKVAPIVTSIMNFIGDYAKSMKEFPEISKLMSNGKKPLFLMSGSGFLERNLEMAFKEQFNNVFEILENKPNGKDAAMGVAYVSMLLETNGRDTSNIPTSVKLSANKYAISIDNSFRKMPEVSVQPEVEELPEQPQPQQQQPNNTTTELQDKEKDLAEIEKAFDEVDNPQTPPVAQPTPTDDVPMSDTQPEVQQKPQEVNTEQKIPETPRQIIPTPTPTPTPTPVSVPTTEPIISRALSFESIVTVHKEFKKLLTVALAQEKTHRYPFSYKSSVFHALADVDKTVLIRIFGKSGSTLSYIGCFEHSIAKNAPIIDKRVYFEYTITGHSDTNYSCTIAYARKVEEVETGLIETRSKMPIVKYKLTRLLNQIQVPFTLSETSASNVVRIREKRLISNEYIFREFEKWEKRVIEKSANQEKDQTSTTDVVDLTTTSGKKRRVETLAQTKKRKKQVEVTQPSSILFTLAKFNSTKSVDISNMPQISIGTRLNSKSNDASNFSVDDQDLEPHRIYCTLVKKAEKFLLVPTTEGNVKVCFSSGKVVDNITKDGTEIDQDAHIEFKDLNGQFVKKLYFSTM